MFRKWIFAAGVFACVVAVFAPCVRYDLVNYDDNEYVYQNAELRNGLNAKSIAWAWNACGYSANWHPLTWISLATDISVARKAGTVKELKPTSLKPEWTVRDGILPFVMHLHNVVLHGLNAVLLFVLLLTLSVRRRDADEARNHVVAAAALSVLWAVHPLRCEVVCWVTERKELLSVFFMLLSLIFHFRGGGVRYVMSLLFFALALASKPVAVSLPVVMLSMDRMLKGRRFGACAVSAAPFFLLSAATCVVTVVAQDSAIVNKSMMDVWARIAMVLEGPVIYILQTFAPVRLAVVYDNSSPDALDWIGAAAGLALVAVMLAVCARWFRRREMWAGICSFAVAWMYVGLIPMLGIVKVGSQLHSDRYTYWVGCGASAMVMLLYREYGARAFRWLDRTADFNCREWAGKATIVVIAVLAVLSWRQTKVWRNTETLFSNALTVCNDVGIAVGLAVEFSERGRDGWRMGEMVLRKVASESPSVQSRSELANYLVRNKDLKNTSEVRMLCEQVLMRDDKCATMWSALALAEIFDGNFTNGVKFAEMAIEYGIDDREFRSKLPLWRENAEKMKRGELCLPEKKWPW